MLENLPNLLTAIIGFIVTISFLVAIHEYGHFWMARKFGVKIEKFSIGFGKPIVKWYGKKENTQYSISWIPLGGYVKMYGENPEDIQPNKNQHDISDITHVNQQTGTAGSFSALPPFKRFLIAFAGPAVNLAFAVLALWLLFIIGVPAYNPYIGEINQQSPLYKQISTGDKFTAINHKKVDTLTDAMIHLVDNIGNQDVMIEAIDANGINKSARISLDNLPSGSEMAIEQALGFQWQIAEVGQKQPAEINTVSVNSPAQQAGLKTNDIVLSANQQPVKYWQDFVNVVQQHPEQTISITVNRNGNTQQLQLKPATHPKNKTIGYAGVSAKFDPSLYDKFYTTKKYNVLSALPVAIKENYLQGKLIIKTLGRLLIGRASIKNMGGPLTIADYSGKSLSAGYVSFFKFLAAISLTLAVMNLLPIPVLDGGHMALCSIEMLRGKPLSEKTAGLLMRVGMSVMLTFMLLVISVDLWKYLLD